MKTSAKGKKGQTTGRATGYSKTGVTGKTSPVKSSARTSQNEEEETGENTLHHLFVEGLKEIYWTEKALVKVLDRFAKASGNDELADAFLNHKAETEDQIERLEQVFEYCETKPTVKRSAAVAGLIEDATLIISEFEEGEVRDAGLIMAAQKIEHFEISTYGTLCTLAEVLGHEECIELLGENLEEEKAADETLNEVAQLVYESVMDTY